mmetsp:Transcript_29476/g.76035  ORF Transcript_29476/g.76035 Transcript_29476/m.76035 type:complete len:257 (+) Transcript_29476:362-1132(+)
MFSLDALLTQTPALLQLCIHQFSFLASQLRILCAHFCCLYSCLLQSLQLRGCSCHRSRGFLGIHRRLLGWSCVRHRLQIAIENFQSPSRKLQGTMNSARFLRKGLGCSGFGWRSIMRNECGSSLACLYNSRNCGTPTSLPNSCAISSSSRSLFVLPRSNSVKFPRRAFGIEFCADLYACTLKMRDAPIAPPSLRGPKWRCLIHICDSLRAPRPPMMSDPNTSSNHTMITGRRPFHRCSGGLKPLPSKLAMRTSGGI